MKEEANNTYDLSLNELNSLKSSISDTKQNTHKNKIQNISKPSKLIKNDDSISDQSHNEQQINSIQKCRNIFLFKTQKCKKQT